MDTRDPKDRGWWWQAFRDPRLMWASTTKLQVIWATAVSSFVVIWCTVRETIPALLPEILGLYMGITILGRAASKGMSIWEKNKEENRKEVEKNGNIGNS